MKLSDMYPIDRDLVVKLIKEEINIDWMRDMIKGKKGIHGVGGHGDLSRAEHFIHLLWDNLTEEQRNKVIESLNLIVEEDLFKERVWEDNYCFHLLDFIILMHKKLPDKINTKPFVIWKEKNFPNLSPPDDPDRPLAKRLREQIENTFLKM